MIRLIGFGRLLSMLLLILVSAMFFIYTKSFAIPGFGEAKRQISKNREEINTLTQKISDMTSGMEIFKSQERNYNKIVQDYAFFNSQNRPEARRLINQIRDESKVLRARYVIQSVETQDLKEESGIGYKILSTDIDFDLEAIEEKDIYEFVYRMNYGFPGQVLIQSLIINRDAEITQPLLRQIGTGQVNMRPLVTAVMKVQWKTMIPDTQTPVESDP